MKKMTVKIEKLVVPKGYKVNPGFIESKTRRKQLLLQPSVHKKIKELAESEGTSFNDYVHTLLEEHLERVERPCGCCVKREGVVFVERL